jgi:hypothetical protein
LTQLDHATAPSPAWTANKVRSRLVEAKQVEMRMPGQGQRKLGSAWPATPLHSFHDMMFWDDARDRVLDQWAAAKGAYPHEVSLMEQALDWLRWLDSGERRCLEAWAFTTARGISLTRILEKRRWSRSTFYRLRDRAASRIADRLNREGVQIR